MSSSKRRRITDATLRGLKPAPAGKRVEIFDTLVPSFGIRSTEKGAHSFICFTRFNGVPARRLIARVGDLPLAEARAKAKEWTEAAARGIDPKKEARKVREAEEGRISFAAALEQYIDKHVKRMRQARDTERELRNYLLPKWERKALADITKTDVRKLIEEIMDRGAERQAHNVFGLCRTFFNWCLETDRLQASPCAGLRPRKLIGEKRIRTRVLDDAEIAAVWNAAEATPYPYGPYIKLLLLTGARKSEASDARRGEFDLDKGTWTVPEERFKSGVTHRVPLSKDAVALLQELPRWPDSDLVFSFDGTKPFNCYSKVKSRLDALVTKQLGREARWQLHDLRRTVRTRLAGLGIPDTVAEQIIGHGRKGLARVYNQHQYEAEQRDALERWAARLRSIVTPPPENVADLEQERRARGMKRKHPPPLPDDLPSVEDARAALSSKETCEEVFGPLRRDDIIDAFKQAVEMTVREGLEVATIEPDPETRGGEIQYIAPVQSAVVAIWMLAQAVILLKTARPGRKPPMSFKRQRIRLGAERLYQHKKKEVGSARAAADVSVWLRMRGIYLDKGSILKGALSRRSKWGE